MKKLFIFLLLSFTLILFTGCLSGVERNPGKDYIDRLSDDSKKAYIQFYAIEGSFARPTQNGILVEKVNGDRFERSWIGSFLPKFRDDFYNTFRVAVTPGKTKFSISAGSYSEILELEALENKILLVRIEAKVNSVQDDKIMDKNIIRTSFSVKNIISKIYLPIKKNAESTLILTQALDDPDYGTRWHAVEKVGELSEFQLKDKIKLMSEKDENRMVREKSTQVLAILEKKSK